MTAVTFKKSIHLTHGSHLQGEISEFFVILSLVNHEMLIAFGQVSSQKNKYTYLNMRMR